MYTWHVTFGDSPAVQDVAARAQRQLAGLPGLDLVPARWLHLTTQGVGFADEVPGNDIAAITGAAERRLAEVATPEFTIGPARVASEGVALRVVPPGALTPLRDALRAAIADVWGLGRVPESAAWTPHVSVAYASASGSADVYVDALEGEDATAAVTAGSVQLILLGRDEHLYEWVTVASVKLGTDAYERQ
jgi:2'-5' RNA ligase